MMFESDDEWRFKRWPLLINDDDGDDFSVTSGNYCNKEIDACYSSPCKNGGACKRKEGGFTCLCAPNFAGKTKIFSTVMVQVLDSIFKH